MKYFFILLILCALQSKAQNISDSSLINVSTARPKLDKHEYFRIFIIKSMINAIDFDKLIKAPKSFAQLASISIAFNKNGTIDTAVVNTKSNEHFRLKKNPVFELKTFKPILEYANTTVILPILYIRMNERDINLENKFLEGFIELFPQNLLNKNIILLKPEVNPFSQIR